LIEKVKCPNGFNRQLVGPVNQSVQPNGLTRPAQRQEEIDKGAEDEKGEKGQPEVRAEAEPLRNALLPQRVLEQVAEMMVDPRLLGVPRRVGFGWDEWHNSGLVEGKSSRDSGGVKAFRL